MNTKFMCWDGETFCNEFNAYVQMQKYRSIKIVIPTFDNFSYLKYFAAIIKACKKLDIEVDIYFQNYDVTNGLSAQVDRLLGKFLVRNFLVRGFSHEIKKVNFKDFNKKEMLKDKFSERFSSWQNLREISTHLELSVKSGLATNKATSILDEDFSHCRKEIEKQIRAYYSNYQLARRLLFGVENALIVLLNGRFASQAPWREVCDQMKLDFFSLEHGTPKNIRFHLEHFQPQEIEKVGEAIRLYSDKSIVSEQDRAGFTQKWFLSQTSNISQNPFLSSNVTSSGFLPLKQNSNMPVLVFFTSSLDEKLSNLSQNMNGWSSVESALLTLSRKCYEENYTLIVRIHPNSINKNARVLIDLVRFLKQNEILHILPWHEISAKELYVNSALVGSWGSTVSLEAAYCGIPTFTLTETKYSKISGIRVFSSNELQSTKLDSIESIPKYRIEKSIYFSQNYGCEIDKVFSIYEKNVLRLFGIIWSFLFRVKQKILARIFITDNPRKIGFKDTRNKSFKDLFSSKSEMDSFLMNELTENLT